MGLANKYGRCDQHQLIPARRRKMRPQCLDTTKAGVQCRQPQILGSDFCQFHQPDEPANEVKDMSTPTTEVDPNVEEKENDKDESETTEGGGDSGNPSGDDSGTSGESESGS